MDASTVRTASRVHRRSTALSRLEDVIATAERWQSEAARALVQIRDESLYSPTYASFDAYVRERWGWERSRAYQLCQFGELLLRLSTKVDTLPVREAHARPLYPLDPDDQLLVWQQVLREVGKSPTAADVERLAAQHSTPLSRSHRGAFPYCGSKASVVPQIISHLPPHQLYVETHAGSAAVLLGKQASRIEVLNDKDDALVNFFCVLRERRDDLLRLLRLTPYALTEWQRCRAGDPNAEAVERARQFYVSVCQSFSGFGEKFNRSTHKPHAVYWRDRMERLDTVAERLRTVVIEALDAVECIAKYDSAKTLFFVDPPYVRSSRSKVGPTYRIDMTDADHLRLIETLKRIKGRALLAGGESGFYAEQLRGWRVCYRHRLPCGTGGSKVGRYATPYRVEMLWANF